MLEILGLLIKISLVVGITQGAVAYLILVERKIAAFAQDRIGPNRVGPLGLLQPIVDGVKMFLKEDVTPGYVNKPIFILAPFLTIVTAMIGFAVVPFGPVGPNGPVLMDGPIQFQIAPGILGSSISLRWVVLQSTVSFWRAMHRTISTRFWVVFDRVHS